MVEVLALDPHTRTLAVNTPVSCSSRPIIVSCAFVLLSEATSGCKCGLNFVLCLWRELSPSIHRTCGSGDPLNLNATVILSPGWATVSGGRGERTIALSANKKRKQFIHKTRHTQKIFIVTYRMQMWRQWLYDLSTVASYPRCPQCIWSTPRAFAVNLNLRWNQWLAGKSYGLDQIGMNYCWI